MIVSAHQPVYLPGIILFNKLALSDACMLLSHCQFVVRSWHQRNRIRDRDAPMWLSVPVNAGYKQPIAEVQVAGQKWRRKHVGSLRQAYGRRPFFDTYFPELVRLLSIDYPSLADLDIALIRCLCQWLEIDTPLHDSRDFGLSLHKTELLIESARALGADHFLSNIGSSVYVEEAVMAEQRVQHHWQRFEHPVYEQGLPFVQDLSVVDLLFNIGPRSAQVVRTCGHIDPQLPGEPK